MMPRSVPSLSVLALVLVATLLPLSADEAEGHEPGEGLLAWMGQLQVMSHKAHLSVEARNAELAEFYLHELDETMEGIEQEVATYDGFPVGAMTTQLLSPRIEALDEAVEANDWEAAGAASRELFEACNSCHRATEHGYIVVEPSSVNPYAQSFEPASDDSD